MKIGPYNLRRFAFVHQIKNEVKFTVTVAQIRGDCI